MSSTILKLGSSWKVVNFDIYKMVLHVYYISQQIWIENVIMHIAIAIVKAFTS